MVGESQVLSDYFNESDEDSQPMYTQKVSPRQKAATRAKMQQQKKNTRRGKKAVPLEDYADSGIEDGEISAPKAKHPRVEQLRPSTNRSLSRSTSSASTIPEAPETPETPDIPEIPESPSSPEPGVSGLIASLTTSALASNSSSTVEKVTCELPSGESVSVSRGMKRRRNAQSVHTCKSILCIYSRR